MARFLALVACSLLVVMTEASSFLELDREDFLKPLFLVNFWNFFTSIASSFPMSLGSSELLSDSSSDEETAFAFKARVRP